MDQLGEDARHAGQDRHSRGLDDPALVEDEDPVGVEEGREPVCDQDDGPVGPRLMDGRWTFAR